jgi:hypothetical protein
MNTIATVLYKIAATQFLVLYHWLSSPSVKCRPMLLPIQAFDVDHNQVVRIVGGVLLILAMVTNHIGAAMELLVVGIGMDAAA